MKSGIQTFLFPRDQWTRGEACRWLKSHGFSCRKADLRGNHYRFRQFSPRLCVQNTYSTKVWASRSFGEARRVLAVFCRKRSRA